jgi:hypothetical protein
MKIHGGKHSVVPNIELRKVLAEALKPELSERPSVEEFTKRSPTKSRKIRDTLRSIPSKLTKSFLS